MGTLSAVQDFLKSRGATAKKRGINAAQQGRLTSTWATQPKPLDTDIRRDLSIARARCRDAAINNDYVKNYLRLLRSNVIGPNGIVTKPQSQNAQGKLDKNANTAIHEAFKLWAAHGVPEVTGNLSWVGCQNLALETAAKDGEFFIRKIYGWKGNAFSFALEFIDPQSIDPNLNADLRNGNVIKMGIEYDKWGAKIAYHVKQRSLLDETYGNYHGKHKRIPAGEILHGFLPESILQSRGYPWLAVALFRAQMLAGYEEAELVAARASSAKMGFLVSDPDGPGATKYEGDTDATGAMLTDAEPGTIETLPPGYKFEDWDPSHPNSAYADFTKQVLRGMGAGLGISYFSMANDLEGVNYSSGRLGSLEDREVWKSLQTWLTDVLIRPVVEEWLSLALLTGQIKVNGNPLPTSKLDKYKRIHYQGRRWAWVDPKKDMEGEILALDRKLKDPQSVIIERGYDPIEVLDNWKAWDDELQLRGLEVTLTPPSAEPPDPEKGT